MLCTDENCEERDRGSRSEALQNQEEDRLTLEAIQDKMSRVNEFEVKFKVSEYEVVTLQAELLQVREQLAGKEDELAGKGSKLAKKEKELVLKEGELEKAMTEIAESAKKISKMEEMASDMHAALNQYDRMRKYLMSMGVQEIVDKIFASDELRFFIVDMVPKI